MLGKFRMTIEITADLYTELKDHVYKNNMTLKQFVTMAIEKQLEMDKHGVNK